MADPEQSLPSDIQGVSTAPVIYFEIIPTFGNNNGVVNMMLAAGIALPAGQGLNTVTKPLAVAHLRFSVATALHLRETLDKALLLGSETQGAAN